MGGHRSDHRRRIRPRKIIRQVIVFLILGAIVNVAVAWGCAVLVDSLAWADYRMGEDAECSHGALLLDRWDKIGSTLIYVTQYPPGHTLGWPAIGPLRDLVPSWIPGREHAFTSLREIDDDSWGTYIAEARGFPMPTFWQKFEHEDLTDDPTSTNGKWVVYGGIPLLQGYYTPRSVPLRPIWPGFLVNTLFYAIILGLFIPGPFVLRRIIRRKRGRCPKCGYDLRGRLPGAGRGCPECGWNRPEVEAT